MITKEIFGPFQVVVLYSDREINKIKEILEKITQNLTAAIVSNDVLFQQDILGNTVNGTTYTGMRARTTGAPQNHWFGPAGDPRSAGIGTPEAIINTWRFIMPQMLMWIFLDTHFPAVPTAAMME